MKADFYVEGTNGGLEHITTKLNVTAPAKGDIILFEGDKEYIVKNVIHNFAKGRLAIIMSSSVAPAYGLLLEPEKNEDDPNGRQDGPDVQDFLDELYDNQEEALEEDSGEDKV